MGKKRKRVEDFFTDYPEEALNVGLRCPFPGCDRVFWRSCDLAKHKLKHPGQGGEDRPEEAEHKHPEHPSHPVQEEEAPPASDYYERTPESLDHPGSLRIQNLQASLKQIFPAFEPSSLPPIELKEAPSQPEEKDNPAFPFASTQEKRAAIFAKEAGLTYPQTRDLLEMMREFGVKGIEVNSMPEINSKILNAYPEVLQEANLSTLFPEADQDLVFHYKEAWDVIKEIFQDKRFENKFIFEWKPKISADGERVFGSLQNGLWWEAMQAQIRAHNKGGCVVPVIVYSDETLSRSIKGKKFYPIYVTIGNLPADIRRTEAAYHLVGYVPELIGTEAEHEAWKKAGVKSRLFHKCLELIFSSLIEPAKRGAMVAAGPQTVCVHPLFCYYIADWPEGKRVTLTRDGVKTALPCHCCGVKREDLSELSNTIRDLPVRSLVETINVIKNIIQRLSTHGSKEKGKATAKENSIHAFENFFWSLPCSNIYFQVSPDLLHQFWSGVVRAFIDSLIWHLESLDNGKELIQQLDDYFKTLPHWKGFVNFNSGISSLSHLTAADYQSILHKMPPAIFSLQLENPHFYLLAANLLDWYGEITNPEVTFTALERIQRIEDRTCELIKLCNILQFFGTPKNHYTLHYVPFVALFETPEQGSAQTGEMSHKRKVKRHFERSNKRNFLNFMMTQDRADEKVQALKFVEPKLIMPLDCQNHLVGDKAKVGIKKLRKDPNLSQLENYLLAYFFESTKVTTTQRSLVSNLTLTTFPSLLLNVQGMKQMARATPSFHSKPRFDTVSILGDSGEIWHAELVLLFQFQGEELAYVRWFIPEDSSELPFVMIRPTDDFQVVNVRSISELVAVSPGGENCIINHWVMEKWKRREARRLSSSAPQNGREPVAHTVLRFF